MRGWIARALVVAVGGMLSVPAAPSSAGAPFAPGAPLSGAKSPRLDSRLSAVSETSETKGATAGLTAARGLGLTVDGSGVRVVVEAGDPLAASAAVAAAGGTVEASAGTLTRATVPPRELDSLAWNAGVRYVRPPLRPRAESTPSEGVAAVNTPAWHARGRTGAGVKVAIVDLGFTGYTAAQASGDLPASVTAVDDCDGNLTTATPHGTAVASIVHGMAPDAQLFLICIADEVGLAQAEAYVKANGITIVNHSVGWFNSSRGDGSGGPGTPDAIVADARAHGILWVNSAGNHTFDHWSGKWIDRNGDGSLDFAPGVQSNSFYGSSGTVCAELKWDDWPATGQDYDIYIHDLVTGSIVSASTTLQNGSQTPTEEACVTGGGAYELEIRKFAGAGNPRLDLFVLGSGLGYTTAASSIAEPAGSPAAFAVGAACWADAIIESYSSQGPSISGRVKPDITGPDSVSGPVYGSFDDNPFCEQGGFLGTSAASAHVAGAAALVEQLHPAWTPGQVQDYLMANALDAGTKGKDNQYGAGLLWLPITTPSVTSFSPSSGPVGTTVTISGKCLGDATQVRFHGIPAVPLSVTATSVKVLVPATATTGHIEVQTPDGVATKAADFHVTPRVTGFEPLAGVRGAPVDIVGSNFHGATSIKFGSSVTTNFAVDGNTIHTFVPKNATTGKVTVTTPEGSGTSALSFQVALKPTISSFSPSSGPVGTLVTVNGSNLGSATDATVNFSDVGGLVSKSPSRLQLIVPTGGVTSGKIRVHNGAGEGTSAGTFRVTPTVEDFSPSSGLPGSTVTIVGATFDVVTGVKFGSVPVAAGQFHVVESGWKLEATVPPKATGGRITVTTTSGSGTSAGSYTVIQAPTLASFTPSSGPVGTAVTLTGTSLGSATAVTIGDVDAGPITVLGPTQIRVSVPAGAVTGKQIAVQNDAGSALSKSKFTVLPRVTGFSPAEGAAVGGAVTISGTSLGGAAVTFNGVPAATEAGSDDSTILTHVPPVATTGKLTVGGASGGTFKVVPTIASLSPAASPVGKPVTITGTTFGGASSVKVNGVAASFKVVNATTIQATVPGSATTGRVTVTTAGGIATSPSDLAVTSSISSLSPSSGATGITVKIGGNGFRGTPEVTFGGVASTAVTVVSPTSLLAVVPPGALSGAVSVATDTGPAAGSKTYTVTFGITSFTPTSGVTGNHIVVSGYGLSRVKNAKIGVTVAEFSISAGNGTVAVYVPENAPPGPISLTDGSWTVRSAGIFTPVPIFVPTDRMVFNANRFTWPNVGPVELFTSNGDGTGIQALTPGGYTPKWSPDGTRIAVSTVPGATGQIAVSNADGSMRTLLGAGGDPAWSPDGSRLVFARTSAQGDRDLWVMNADGTEPHEVLTGPADDFEPVWSPNGTTIAFTEQSGAASTRRVATVHPDGSGLVLLAGADGWSESPEWSPDGTKLLFGHPPPEVPNQPFLWIMDADGTHASVFPFLILGAQASWARCSRIVAGSGSAMVAMPSGIGGKRFKPNAPDGQELIGFSGVDCFAPPSP